MNPINYIELEKDFLTAEKNDDAKKKKKRIQNLIVAFAIIPIVTKLILDWAIHNSEFMVIVAVVVGPAMFFRFLITAIINKEYMERHALLKKNIKMINTTPDYPHVPIEMIEENSGDKTLAEYKFLKQAYDLKADMIIAVNLNNNVHTSVRTNSTNNVESTTHNNFHYIGTAVKF